MVFTEGVRDALFFSHYLKRHHQLDVRHKSLQEAMRKARACYFQTILTECGGFPKIVDAAVRIARQLLGEAKAPSMVVVGDSDKLSRRIFKQKLEEFLKTPCKLHNIDMPQITEHGDGQTLDLYEPSSQCRLKIRVITVPQSLEHQILRVLSQKYDHPLKKEYSEDDFDKIVDRHYRLNPKDAIVDAVELLAGEDWLRAVGEAVKECVL